MTWNSHNDYQIEQKTEETGGPFGQKLHNISRLAAGPVINVLHIHHIVKLQD